MIYIYSHRYIKHVSVPQILTYELLKSVYSFLLKIKICVNQTELLIYFPCICHFHNILIYLNILQVFCENLVPFIVGFTFTPDSTGLD